MKLALISVHYPPLRSSCAVQMRDLAKELINQGHEPVVIVPDENLSSPFQYENSDGVEIYRLTSPKIINIGNIKRALNEIMLPFIMLNSLRKTNLNLKKIEGVIWYSPTIFFGPIVWYIKRVSGSKSYLILRDIFPEWALDLNLLSKGPIYYLFKLAAKFQYSVADSIGVQTESNLQYLFQWKRRGAKRNLEVLNNWISPTNNTKSSIELSKTSLSNRKIFAYIGNMGIAQGMEIIIELAKEFLFDKNIGFVFVGRGTELSKLKLQAKEHNLDNILFFDEIPSEEIQDFLSQAHVGLIALDPRHKSHNIPGKFLSYLQAGLPVLARVNKGTDLEGIIERERVGAVYSSHNIKEFYELALNLIDNQELSKTFSDNGTLLAKNMFSSETAAKKILSAINEI